MKLALALLASLLAACEIRVVGAYEVEYALKSRDQSLDEEQIRELVLQRVDSMLGLGGIDVSLYDGGELRLRIRPALDARGLAEFRQRLEHPRMFEIIGVADTQTPGIDYDAELKRYRVWGDANPDVWPVPFNALRGTREGPSLRVRWYLYVPDPSAGPIGLACVDTDAVHPGRGWQFTIADVEGLEACVDHLGQPQIAFSIVEGRAVAWRDFTEHYVDRQIAIVIDDEVVAAPFVNDPLPPSGVIDSRWTTEVRDQALHKLQLESLPIKFKFVAAHQNR